MNYQKSNRGAPDQRPNVTTTADMTCNKSLQSNLLNFKIVA